MTVFELDSVMMNTIRGAPARLIREDKIPPEVAKFGSLVRVSTEIERQCPAIGGWLDHSSPPSVVVTGICQGSGKTEEKKQWLERGPSLETAANIHAAHRLAASFPECKLEIWIVDQEYANIMVDKERYSSTPSDELKVGKLLERWCQERFPKAEIFRTSDPSMRGPLYATLSNGGAAGLYPTGVPEPYGNKGTLFWQEMQYLASVAVFMHTQQTKNCHVLAIADHEQLRALAAAKRLGGVDLSTIALWPSPRLGWIPPKPRADESATRYAERYLYSIKSMKRRMYRADSIMEILYCGLKLDEVHERFAENRVCRSTACELLRFMGMDQASADLCCEDPTDSVFNYLNRDFTFA